LAPSEILGRFFAKFAAMWIVGAKIPRISETKIARAKGFVRSA
jgi:hypothetical protein